MFLGEVQTFPGNQKTHNNHFKLLHQDGSSLLIGARNSVYNTSLEVSCDWWISNLAGSSSLIGQDLSERTEQQRIEWGSGHRDTALCLVKGKSEEECSNYIRVVIR